MKSIAKRGTWGALALPAALLLVSAAQAAEKPRVAVMPLEATSQLQALPPSVGVQLLAAVAARDVDMPSSFDVDDALTALKDPQCQASDACLAQVAHATRAGWTLAVHASQRAAVWVLGGRVVKADGAVVRRREPLPVSAGPDGALDWARAFRSLLDALALESLGQPAAPPAVATPSPAAGPAPPLAPAPSPSVVAAPVVVRTRRRRPGEHPRPSPRPGWRWRLGGPPPAWASSTWRKRVPCGKPAAAAYCRPATWSAPRRSTSARRPRWRWASVRVSRRRWP